MVSAIVHYLLYIAISVAFIAPLVAALIIKKTGKAGFAPYLVGALMFFSVTVLQSMVQFYTSSMSKVGGMILYCILFVLLEVVGYYFFVRMLIREKTTAKCLAAGAMYGGVTGIMYGVFQLFQTVGVILAMNRGELDGIIAANPELAQTYENYRDFALSLTWWNEIPLVLYGAACVMFFAFIGALMANAFNGKPIYFLWAGLAALVYEAPSIIISTVAGQELYAYAYQVVVAVAAAILIRRVVDETEPSYTAKSIEINRRLR